MLCWRRGLRDGEVHDLNGPEVLADVRRQGRRDRLAEVTRRVEDVRGADVGRQAVARVQRAGLLRAARRVVRRGAVRRRQHVVGGVDRRPHADARAALLVDDGEARRERARDLSDERRERGRPGHVDDRARIRGDLAARNGASAVAGFALAAPGPPAVPTALARLAACICRCRAEDTARRRSRDAGGEAGRNRRWCTPAPGCGGRFRRRKRWRSPSKGAPASVSGWRTS